MIGNHSHLSMEVVDKNESTLKKGSIGFVQPHRVVAVSFGGAGIAGSYGARQTLPPSNGLARSRQNVEGTAAIARELSASGEVDQRGSQNGCVAVALLEPA